MEGKEISDDEYQQAMDMCYLLNKLAGIEMNHTDRPDKATSADNIIIMTIWILMF